MCKLKFYRFKIWMTTNYKNRKESTRIKIISKSEIQSWKNFLNFKQFTFFASWGRFKFICTECTVQELNMPLKILPDEWATTKQACRDELVVYLFFSPIYTSLYFYVLSTVLRTSNFTLNGLKANPEKFQAMILGKQNWGTEEKESMDLLGVNLDIINCYFWNIQHMQWGTEQSTGHNKRFRHIQSNTAEVRL